MSLLFKVSLHLHIAVLCLYCLLYFAILCFFSLPLFKLYPYYTQKNKAGIIHVLLIIDYIML